MRLRAEWERVTISSCPANMTSCSPTDGAAAYGMDADLTLFARTDEPVPPVNIFLVPAETFVDALCKHERRSRRGILFHVVMAFDDLRIECIAEHFRRLLDEHLQKVDADGEIAVWNTGMTFAASKMSASSSSENAVPAMTMPFFRALQKSSRSLTEEAGEKSMTTSASSVTSAKL